MVFKDKYKEIRGHKIVVTFLESVEEWGDGKIELCGYWMARTGIVKDWHNYPKHCYSLRLCDDGWKWECRRRIKATPEIEKAFAEK